MHIAIDGNEANVQERVGIGEYAYQLLTHLSNYQDQHRFTIFLKDTPLDDLPKNSQNWRYKIIGPRFFWTQIALPLKLYFSKRPDLFFSPTHYAPRFSSVPRVISVMDLSYVRYPTLFKKSDLIKLKNWTSYSVKKAKVILTISEFSKKEIINYYKIAADKIFVTYPGYNQKIYHNNYLKEEVEKIKEEFNLGDYLIFVGTIQPRKNVQSLIIAFNKISKNFPNLKLVIIGKKGWLYKDIFDLIQKQTHPQKILYLGYLEDIQIAKLYNGALCFVLPSLYEGFGLPVIEAMACGCPTVISDTTSLPEISGNAAVLINPYSIDSLIEGILKLISKDQKYFREEMIKRGLIQVKKFSWSKCAEKTLRIFENIVN